MIRYVAVHPEWGVFVGAGLGMAFFTLQDTAGQFECVTFETPQEAAQLLVLEWKLPNRMRYVAVNVPDGSRTHGATAAVLRAAGLSDYVADLEKNFLIYAKPEGGMQ